MDRFRLEDLAREVVEASKSFNAPEEMAAAVEELEKFFKESDNG